jgi:hypothetical protein
MIGNAVGCAVPTYRLIENDAKFQVDRTSRQLKEIRNIRILNVLSYLKPKYRNKYFFLNPVSSLPGKEPAGIISK